MLVIYFDIILNLIYYLQNRTTNKSYENNRVTIKRIKANQNKKKKKNIKIVILIINPPDRVSHQVILHW